MLKSSLIFSCWDKKFEVPRRTENINSEQLGKRIITELFSARHDDMPKNHTIKAAVEYAYKRIRVH